MDGRPLLCIDCKHLDASDRDPRRVSGNTDCLHPRAEFDMCLVTGRVYRHDARRMRQLDCGTSGKLWEPVVDTMGGEG